MPKWLLHGPQFATSISAAWSHRSCSGSTMIIGSNRQSKSHHDAPKYPIASRITNLHSHSMVLDDGNALIFQRKFFSDGQSPTVSPSNFFAFDFKGKIARFKFCAA